MEDTSKLLKDLTHYDSHYRQNAVRFLSQKFIENRTTMSEDEKGKIIAGILTKLNVAEDSLDVKGIAVKVLGDMSKYIKDNDIMKIFSELIKYITDPKAEGKDIYTSCIKKIFEQISGASCIAVGKIIIPEILKGISINDDHIRELCYDTFSDYISSFNYVLINRHKEADDFIKNKDNITQNALKHIDSNNDTLRNRIGIFLGNFSLILSKQQLNFLLESLIKKIVDSKELSDKTVSATVLNLVAKVSGVRHVDKLRDIVKIAYQYSCSDFLNNPDFDFDHKNDFVDAILTVLETYIVCLSKSLEGDAEKLKEYCLNLIAYDPNYTYSDEANAYGEDYGDDYGDYGGGYYPTDDDSSWKVRRSATKILASLVKSRLVLSKPSMSEIIHHLTKCIGEHSENVKIEIINCLGLYLKYFVVDSGDDETGLSLVKVTSGIYVVDSNLVQDMITRINNELKKDNDRITLPILHLYLAVTLAVPDIVLNHFHILVDELDRHLNKNINSYQILITLARFTRNISRGGDQLNNFKNFFSKFFNWVELGLKHSFYKVHIASLNLLFNLIELVVSSSGPSEYKDVAQRMVNMMIPIFKTNDIDQELKQAVVVTMGNLLKNMGHVVSVQNLELIFSIYLEKTANENLRTSIFNWLTKAVNNNPNLKVDAYLSKFLPSLLENINKNNVILQRQSLDLLTAITQNQPDSLKNYDEPLGKSLTALISENNLSLFNVIFDLLNLLTTPNFAYAKNQALLAQSVDSTIKALEIDDNESNYGSALSFLSNAINLNCVDKNTLTAYITNILKFNKFNHIKAKALAIISNKLGNATDLVSDIEKKLDAKASDEQKRDYLILLGEIYLICKKTDSSIFEYLEKMLQTTSDLLKTPTAECIGRVGVCNPKKFFDIIAKNTKSPVFNFYIFSIYQFLLVVSKQNAKVDNLDSYYTILRDNANNTSEKLRQISGECLALLSLMNESYLKNYIQSLELKDNVARSTYLYGLRTLFQPKTIQQEVLVLFEKLLFLSLRDSDLQCKENAFYSLVGFVHNYTDLLKDSGVFRELFDVFNQEYVIKPELVEEVNLGGGIKVKNDKCEKIRKSIYTTIKLLLENIPEKFHNPIETLTILQYGLTDNEDIFVISNSCLLKLSHLAPEAFTAVIDSLCDFFNQKIKEIQIPARGEKVVDVKKLTDVCLNVRRLFDALKKVPEINDNPKFVDTSNNVDSILAAK